MKREKLTVKTRTTTVALAASEIKSVRFVSTKKQGYRVIEGGKIGIYGTAGEYDEEKAWKKAEENLKNQIPYAAEFSENRKESVDASKKLLSDKEFVERVKQLLQSLKEKCPQFLYSNNILKVETETRLVNDSGLDLSYKTNFYQVSIRMKEKLSANIFDSGYSYSGQTFDVEKIVADIEEHTRAYFTPVDIKAGEYPVLTSIYDLGFSKLYSDIRADSCANGTGLFAGKTGKQVFDERVTIYEDRNPESCFSEPFFDDEGVVNKEYRNIIFDRGVFRSPLASKTDAKKYDIPVTGSAVSSYDGVPQTGISQVRVRSSGKTIKELTKGEDCVYIVMCSGGDTTPDGNFATPVQVAFLCRDGKFVGRLPEIGVSGNLFDIYGKNFIGQAEDSLSHTDCSDYKPLIVRMKVTK